MRNALALAAVLALPISSASAAGLEGAAALSELGFAGSLGGFRLPRLALSPLPLAAAKAIPDLAGLFDKGTAPTQHELEGWRAGRRFTKDGPAAALLVGREVYDDPDEGPISGKTFKVFFFGPDKPGIVPADLYDDPGSETQNNVAWVIREQGRRWSAAEFKEKAALTRKDSAPPLEIRKAGEYLVARYPDGSYGYFFKKVRK